MIVCDICGGKFDSNNYNARVHIEPEVYGLYMRDSKYTEETRERDFCQTCWKSVIRYVDRLCDEGDRARAQAMAERLNGERL